MKKYLAMAVVAVIAMISVFSFTSCSSDDGETQTYVIAIEPAVSNVTDSSVLNALLSTVVTSMSQQYSYVTSKEFTVSGSATLWDATIIGLSNVFLPSMLQTIVDKDTNSTFSLLYGNAYLVIYNKSNPQTYLCKVLVPTKTVAAN